MKYYCRFLWLLSFSVLLVNAGLALPDMVLGATGTAGVTGCYSDMYYNEEGGDLLGYEFVIVDSPKGYYLFYQESGGEPDTPLLLPVEIKGSKIRLVIPFDDTFPRQFDGKITAQGIIGRFRNNPDEEIRLARKRSYWQREKDSLTVTGCYSNMHSGRGKAVGQGHEFFIVFSRNGYYALYRSGREKGAMPQVVPLIVDGLSISCVFPYSDSRFGYFAGRITAEGLTGTFGGEHIVLKNQDVCGGQ